MYNKKLEKEYTIKQWPQLVGIREKWTDIIIKKFQQNEIISVTDHFKQFVDRFRKII